jgi:hypothetical protein
MCDCIVEINKLLAPRNTQLDLVLSLSGKPDTVMIGASVIEKKRGARPIIMTANFCPFCGEKYMEDVSDVS